MSYILEALRKSERERALGQVPSLDTPNDRVRPAPLMPWVVAAVALVALVAVAGLWLLRDPGPTVPDSAQAPPSTPVPQPAAQSPVSPAPLPAEHVPVVTEPLPPALGEQLPPLAVNVLSYSDDPAKRFIMINQRILREGERLGAEIVVRDIMPDGARLEFRGHEFLVRP